MWKYVDDTKVSETILKGSTQSKSQEAVDVINHRSKENKFQLNGDKTKQLTISFGRNPPLPPTVHIDWIPIQAIQCTTLLGFTINDKLTWNDHVEDFVKRSSKKMYFLVQLKRACLPTVDLVKYYRACIRSSLDYACPVFHYALPKYLQIELETVQKRAPSFIFSREHYSGTLQLAGLPTIRAHQEGLSKQLFNSIFSHSSNKAHGILPKPRTSTYALNKQRKFSLPAAKTQRFA